MAAAKIEELLVEKSKLEGERDDAVGQLALFKQEVCTSLYGITCTAIVTGCVAVFTTLFMTSCGLSSALRCRPSLMRRRKQLLKHSTRCDNHRGCFVLCHFVFLSLHFSHSHSPLLPLPLPLSPSPSLPPPLQSVAAREKLSAELDVLRQQVASITSEKEGHEKVAKSVEDKVCGVYVLEYGGTGHCN